MVEAHAFRTDRVVAAVCLDAPTAIRGDNDNEAVETCEDDTDCRHHVDCGLVPACIVECASKHRSYKRTNSERYLGEGWSFVLDVVLDGLVRTGFAF